MKARLLPDEAWFGFRSILVVWLCVVVVAHSDAGEVRLLRMPDEGLQPQVAVENGRTHLIYLKGDPAESEVFYRSRAPGQTNFSEPIRVNSQRGTAIAIGNVRGAQMALGGAYLHVVWNGSAKSKTPQNPRGGLLYTRAALTDGALLKFEPERDLMKRTFNLDGGGSVASDGAGNVYVVWHAHEKGVAEEDESHRGVYVATSRDNGGTFETERKVTDASSGVCGCCGLRAYAPGPDELAILYRSAGSGAHRDMVLMLSTNAGQTFNSRTVGKWKVSTCPMSTPWLGMRPDGALLAAWETDGQVYWTKVDPTKLEVQSPILEAVPKPSAAGGRKHPRFAFSSQRSSSPELLITWVEGTGWEKGGRLAWELATSTQSVSLVDGVKPWTFSAALPDSDGGFTILY